jgi:hypothetical protein
MTIYYLNGTQIPEDSDITLNGFTYPYSWLEGTSSLVRASLGIEKQGEVNYDSKYYWGLDTPKELEDQEEVDKQGNPLYVKVFDPTVVNEGTINVGAMVDTEERLVTKGLKTICTEEIKSTTNTLLQKTDFYILRNAVEELQIPESVTTYRTAVINESNRVTNAISEVTTIEELIELMNSVNWDKKEDLIEDAEQVGTVVDETPADEQSPQEVQSGPQAD